MSQIATRYEVYETDRTIEFVAWLNSPTIEQLRAIVPTIIDHNLADLRGPVLVALFDSIPQIASLPDMDFDLCSEDDWQNMGDLVRQLVVDRLHYDAGDYD